MTDGKKKDQRRGSVEDEELQLKGVGRGRQAAERGREKWRELRERQKVEPGGEARHEKGGRERFTG